MKKLKLLLSLSLLFTLASAQVSEDFKQKFEKSRYYLEEFQYEKAAPILEGMLEKDPTNANLQFLLAVCYTMGPVVDNRAISLLENAKQEVKEEYDARSPEERGVSQNVYFYLAVAYAQSFNFEEANKANDHYHELTGTINGRYMRDAKLWIDKMAELKDLLATAPVEAYDDTYGWGDDEGFVDEETVNETIASEEVFEKKSQESQDAKKFYGVQIGAFAQSIPSYIFSGTENVKAYKGKEGIVRFVVGNVSTREEAESIRDKMRRAGYTDAFIVHLDRDDFIEEIK
jgi:tetratricopeptide (TPR) repeat protein